MSWNPRQKIIDTRFLGQNILSFVADNQADALEWANGGEPLKELQEFAVSIANRNAPVLPSIAIADDGNATDFGSDVLKSAYEITLEIMVGNASATDAANMARCYKHALESMLLNIPKTDLFAGAEILLDFRISGIETGFDEIKASKSKNYFMQMFQTKVIYELYASAY